MAKIGLDYQNLASAAYQSFNLGWDAPTWDQLHNNERQRWISAVSSAILEFQIQRSAMREQKEAIRFR